MTFNALNKAFKIIWKKNTTQGKKLTYVKLYTISSSREKNQYSHVFLELQNGDFKTVRGSQSLLHTEELYKSINAWADLVSLREGPGSTIFRAIKVILSWKSFMA